MSNHNNGVIFLATVLSKMSQMFTELNSMYLQAMLNKDSITKNSPINVNTLMSQFKQESKEEIISHGEESGSESEQKPHVIVQNQNKQEKVTKTSKISQNKTKVFMDQPPHPPPSSYLLFFQQHREKIAKQFPNLKVSELSKIASKCWKELTDQQKKPYHQKFNQEKEKYYEALKAYNLSKGQAQLSSVNQRDKKSKLNKNPLKEEIKPKQKGQQKQLPRHEDKNESDSSDDDSLLI